MRRCKNADYETGDGYMIRWLSLFAKCRNNPPAGIPEKNIEMLKHVSREERRKTWHIRYPYLT